jgi:hypothetical protein
MNANRKRVRRGYAMIMVILFLVLFLGLWSQATGQIASMIRIEEARQRRVQRDTARLPASTSLARAIAALEVGFPPSTPYSCTATASDGTALILTFERAEDNPDEWIVSAVPGSSVALPQFDPEQFATTAPSP